MKYRKKPVVIEAIQFDDSNYIECEKFIGKENYDNTLNYPNIKTLEGTMRVSVGDYVIRGIKGEFYPCKPDIFEMTYESVESIREREHIESQHCWCGPTLIQAIDDQHDCEVWSHKGHEELNQ